MTPKQRAAEAALQYVRSNTDIGLGTGSTADYFLLALAAALKDGRLKNLRGVPTSEQTDGRARELGIQITSLDAVSELDVTVDGADEVAPNLDLIKGLGGALLREKIVAQNSRRLIIIADASKCVDVLGTHSALPVEVIPFAHGTQKTFLESLNCTATLRKLADGSPYLTDSQNFIYDCRFQRIPYPPALAQVIADRAGIVESGLFLQMAHLALISGETDVQVIERHT